MLRSSAQVPRGATPPLSWRRRPYSPCALFVIALPEQRWNAGWDPVLPCQAREPCLAFRDKPMEKAKINFDWPLDLLRSETVKVYVNNEINILVLFWAKWGSILIQMCFGLKNSFVNLGMSFFILLYNFCYFIFFFPVIPKTFWN